MKKSKKHFTLLIGIYIVILIWGIILKASDISTIISSFNYMIKLDLYSRFTRSPLNPFSILYTTKELNILNTVAFIPYGFIVSALSEKKTFLKVAGLSLLLSLIFEILQIFTAIGGFATSDLMYNTLGGIVGFVIFAVLDLVTNRFTEKTREDITRAVVIICYICFVPLAIYGVGKTIYNLDFYLSLIEPMLNSLR